jgi:hypothetical protein
VLHSQHRVVSFLALTFLLAVSARAEPREFETITVKPGQTLWDIAQRYLDDPQRWDEILKHNPKLNADLTVALPGMSLTVPTKLLKASLRAAVLTFVEGEILHRARGSERWVKAKQGMPLSPGDALKTSEWSRARLKFPHGSVLNLDSHSEAIIRPDAPEAPDLELVRGVLKAKQLKLGAGGVLVAPDGPESIYEVTAKAGAPVKVQVFSGAASVASAGKTRVVASGKELQIAEGAAPPEPSDMTGEPLVSVRKPKKESATSDLGAFNLDLETLQPGVPLAGFRVQMSKTEDFKTLVLDKIFEPDEKVSLGGAVGRGYYWWRAAPIDLLGVAGEFSEPKRTAIQ